MAIGTAPFGGGKGGLIIDVGLSLAILYLGAVRGARRAGELQSPPRPLYLQHRKYLDEAGSSEMCREPTSMSYDVFRLLPIGRLALQNIRRKRGVTRSVCSCSDGLSL